LTKLNILANISLLLMKQAINNNLFLSLLLLLLPCRVACFHA